MEIMNDILLLSENGAKKTQLLYKGNLSYTLLNNYLNYLLEKDILEEQLISDNGTINKLYKPTKKGLELLNDFKKIFNTLKL